MVSARPRLCRNTTRFLPVPRALRSAHIRESLMQLSAELAAVVTGGASGLGAATARALRQAGVKVALFGRDEVRGVATAQELGALFCKVDVTSDESVDEGFAAARK